MTTNKSLLFAIAVLSCTVMACRVGKEFTRPATAVPAQYRDMAAPADSSNIGQLSWKTFFTDPALQTLIDSAIAHNFDIQTALKNAEISAQTLKTARLGNLPDINLQIQANRSYPSKNSLNGSMADLFMGTRYMDDYNANVSLSWEVVAWGKISRMKEAALAGYLASNEAARAVQTRIVSEVAQGYYNLLMLDQQHDIAARNLALNDSTLSMMQLQYQSGMINNLAIEQTAAQRQVAAALLPQLEQQIILQENALSILTGTLPASVSRSNRPSSVVTGSPLQAGVPASLLSQRPDVQAAEMAVKVANAKAGIAQASMYPALNITATAGLNTFKASNWFSIPGSLFETVAGSITQPIFQRKKLKTDWEIAKIEWEKAAIDFRKSVLTAVGEVSDALVKIDKLKAQQEMTQLRVDKLHSATQNAGLLFQSGMATYLEVITAQSNVLQSELDLASVQRAQQSAVVELYRSLGGGWK